MICEGLAGVSFEAGLKHNNWHFVLIFLPVQKHLFYLSPKYLTMNLLNKATHISQTTFGCKVNISISDCPNISTTYFTFPLSFTILFIYLC